MRTSPSPHCALGLFRASSFAAVLGSLLLLPVTVSATPPTNFAVEDIVTGIDQPMSIRFLPDGRMLLAQKKGTLSIAEVLGTTRNVAEYADIADHVFGLNFSNERGVIDLAVDPDFPAEPYIYVMYTPASTPGGAKLRVSRFSHVENSGGVTSSLDLSSEQLLWEDTEGYDSCCHFGGGLDFGPEGKLWITTGDHFQGSYATSLTRAGGKVHRIEKDGSIPADNPFNDGAGPNVDSTFAFGLRNPFRARWDLVSNTFYISEVGGNTQTTAWEDLHVIRYDATSSRFIDDDFGSGSDNGLYDGINFGWPTVEGLPPYSDWPAASIDDTGEPVFAYRHNNQTAAINGGIVYYGSQFPAEYQGTYFYADSTRDFIRMLRFNPDGSVAPNSSPDPIDGQNPDSLSYPFDLAPVGRIVSLEEGPDGALYYVSFTDAGGAYGQPNPSVTGAVRRYVYDGGNTRPQITSFDGLPQGGNLTVDFTIEATDLNGDAMSYTLDYGDGSSDSGSLAEATPLVISHTYAGEGAYTATLSVSDGSLESTENLGVQVGTPPIVTSLTAVNDNPVPQDLFFRFGDTYTFAAAAEDGSGDPIPASNFTWSISFIRPGNTHPAVGPVDGVSSLDFPVPSQGQGFSGPVFYRAFVTVTDDNGLSTTSSIDIFPEKANITFDTVPSGIVVQVDGNTSIATPFVLDTLVNYEHVITVPTTDCLDNSEYVFTDWTDGPTNEQRAYVVPTTDSALTANFAFVGDCGPPADLVTEGLVLHLESDLNVAPGAGNDIAAWLDQSGLGNDLDAVGNPQIISGGAPSGLDAIEFDGIDDSLVRNHATSPLGGLPLGNNDRSIFVVTNVPGPASAWAGAAYGNAANSQAFGLVTQASTGKIVLQGYGPADVVTTADAIGEGWMVQSATVGGGLSTVYRDGALITQQARTYNTQPDKLILGEEIGGLGNVAMQLGSVLIYDRKLSESERQSVENYLQQKYIATGPVNTAPQVAITAPTSGSSFDPGESITFIATATDAEDGDLSSSIAWVSDLDGPLGIGDSISIASLSDGNHTISASVNDSGSLMGNDSVLITVGQPATSLPVANGLVTHLESTDSLSAPGGNVAQWGDLSGFGNALFGSGDPQLTTTPNGLPAIGLDGADDKLERLNATDPLSGLPVGNDDRTMIVVVNYPGGSTAYAGVAYGNSAASQTFGLGVKHPDGKLVIQGYGAADLVSNEDAFGSGWMIQTGTVGGGLATLYRNGTQIAQAPRTYSTQLNKMVIGEEIAGAGHVTMEVAAVVVYNRLLNPTERQSVEAYLQQKYLNGSPSNTAPSVAISAPSDGDSFSAGESITFTASASDNEDGDLSASIEWSSSLDGVIGSGASISTSGLSGGIHSITASVTDSGLLSASESLEITVDNPSTTLPVANGLVLQLEATDGLDAPGGVINEWADQSGRGNTLFPGGEPQLTTTSNGTVAIALDGIDDKLERLNASDPLNALPTGNDDRTMFVVVNYPGGSTAYAGAAYGNGAASQTFGLGVKHPDGKLVIQGFGAADLVSDEDAFGTGWMIQTGTVGGGFAELFRDGNQIAKAARTYDTQLNKIIIGEEIAGAGHVTMEIAAVVIYNRELSTSERESVEDYLAQKYLDGGPGNSAPNVAISTPANNSSFTSGESITFSATASDNEDGDLSAAIAWSSNLNGVLGTGASISSSSLSLGTHEITASVTDSGSLSGTDLISISVVIGNTAPTVTISAPTDGSVFEVGQEVTFTAGASDNEDGDLSSAISWSSNLDGNLGNGASIAISDLSAGSHLISASVTDSGSLSGTDSVSISVNSGSGELPVVDITSPDDGSAFTAGQQVTFEAVAFDPDGVSFEPLSLGNALDLPGFRQVDGANANFVVNLGEIYTNDTADPVTIKVERFRFHATRVTDPLTPFLVRVNGADDFTVLAIGDPQSGYNSGENDVAFSTEATSISVAPGETIAPGFIDNLPDGTPGSQNGAVTFVDGGDNIAYRYDVEDTAVTLEVGQNPMIDLPYTIPGAIFRDYFFSIEIEVGSGLGGNLSDDIEWSSDLDGPLGTGASLTLSNLSSGTHVVTAAATDSDAQTGTDTVMLTVIASNGPPNVAITAPADNSVFDSDENISFTATALDGEDGDLGPAIQWTSDLDGSLGSGNAIATSALSEGTHLVTASVTDSGSLTASDSITVSVVAPNEAPVVEITSPGDGSSFDSGETVNFTATASDPDGTAFEPLSLGNALDLPGFRQVDGANANFVVNLSEFFTNESNEDVTLTIERFRFHASRVTDPLTPFIVRVNGIDDFTVLAVGDPQTGYSIGENDLAFGTTPVSITLAPGETIVPGFIDNLPDGTPGTQNGAITFVDGGDDIAYRYDVENTGVTLVVGEAPVIDLPYTVPASASFRDYFFSIEVGVGSSSGGDLSGSITWSSDLDGPLGTGASLSVSDLSTGSHVITASVSDDGIPAQTGTDSIVVQIIESSTPELVASGLAVHLDASLGIETDDGGNITSWDDQSGNGQDVFASGDPTLVANATPTGGPALRLDGNGDRFLRVHATDPISIPRFTQDRTVYLVARFGNGSPANAGFAWGRDLSNRTFGLVPNDSGNLMLHGNGSSNNFDTSASLTNGDWTVIEALLDGSQLTLSKDGQSVGSFTHNFDTRRRQLIIGQELEGGDYAEMDVAAVLVYERALSTAERSQMNDYLSERFIQSLQSEAAIGGLPAGYLSWLDAHGLTGQVDGDSDGDGMSNLDEFLLGMDPTDRNDDVDFALQIEVEGTTALVSYPTLMPTGSFHLHRSNDPGDLANLENRFHTFTSGEIAAMSESERSNTVLEVDCSDQQCGFFMLFFEADEPAVEAEQAGPPAEK